ncbi:hypothetical protein PPO43_15165 [Saprospira sp. CCB-QB6]|uniref:hypothetical protein n=1 Tax=Saprospira sp. CCB-QB6 TaxID=3023936 RepID=UPI00234B2855|nr:hypothetical protein [Saprospira sp. CCB-QB6]WCL81314.1 hypothetical protein PPO43_15165 [Saprospira sp. CCB-QB6]
MKQIDKDPAKAAHYNAIGAAAKADGFLGRELFNNFKWRSKNQLFHALAEEQGYICCYCMSEIKDREDANGVAITKDGLSLLDMSIEHFEPLTDNDGLITDYNNLFASCSGGKRSGKANRYCDPHKGETELVHIPNMASLPAIDFDNQLELYYTVSGEVYSNNPNIERELEDVLNLNAAELKRIRRRIWNRVRLDVKDIADSEGISEEEAAEQELPSYERKGDDGKFYSFAPMVVYLLKSEYL